ncbi:hypothetical protein MTO96_011555 [Rhipicephalus appendiculatus]
MPQKPTHRFCGLKFSNAAQLPRECAYAGCFIGPLGSVAFLVGDVVRVSCHRRRPVFVAPRRSPTRIPRASLRADKSRRGAKEPRPRFQSGRAWQVADERAAIRAGKRARLC